MSLIGPIEPWIHVPSTNPCLDRRNEAQRRASFQPSLGLRSLIPNPQTPVAAASGLDSGRWSPAGRRGIYLVREEVADATAIEKVRHCWVAAVAPESRRFVPVVSAERDLVDRLSVEVRRGGVDPTGVVAFYRDEDHRLEKLLDSRRGIRPLSSLTSSDGSRTQIWCLSHEESRFVGGVLEECGGGIVGDVPLYRALVRLRDDPNIASDTHPVVRFYHQRDFGVGFAPTARLYRGSFDVNGAIERLHRFYDISEYRLENEAQRLAFVERVRNDGVTQRAVGLFARGTRTAYIVRAEENQVKLVEYENTPPVAARFDVEWIEKGILRRLFADALESGAITLASVETELATVPERLERLGAGLGFVVNPPPKREIAQLAQANWRLPVGSLVLRPSIPRGLFLSPLRPATQSLV